MAEVNFAGRLRGKIVSKAWEESSTSDAVAIVLNLSCRELYFTDDPPGFAEPSNLQPTESYELQMRLWLVGKEGKLNESAVGQLKAAIGWDGDWAKLNDETMYIGTTVQVDVKEEEWKGTKQYKASWLYHAEAVPGIARTAAPEKVTALAQRFGADTRAMCGGQPTATRPAPGTRPSVPQPARPAPASTPPPPANSIEPPKDEAPPW